MSNYIEGQDQRREFGREGGLDGFDQRAAGDSSGGVLDDDVDAIDHFALLYEDQAEQFASVLPFIAEGLERGERCLYVADDNSREDVLAALRDYDIDIDAALESGALTVDTAAETYRRTGEFDRASMMEFWEDELEEAKATGGYSGLRAAAEMTWMLEGDLSADELAEYEALLNPLYEDEDFVVMCQYNRGRFPSEVVHDVIKTHPYIVADNSVSQNFYFTPPEQFFGDEAMETKIDRMLATLDERTEVKRELEERRVYLERVFESSHDAIIIVDPAADTIVDANAAASEMLGYPQEDLLSIAPSDIAPNDRDLFEEFGADVFMDGTGWVDDITLRTNDGDQIPVEISASGMELEGRPVLLAVVRDISDRRKRERGLRRLYEVTADPDREMEEKLQDIFELGCRYFDLELGGIARIDPETDSFEVERTNGDDDDLIPGEQYPLSETYCRLLTGEADTVGVVDPLEAGFDENLCYTQFGVQTYFGTYFDLDYDGGRSLFFVSHETQDVAFSEADQTFLRLMGQWVKYELTRQHRKEELEERKEHLRAIVKNAPECIKTVAPDGTLLQMNPAGLEIAEADSDTDIIGECIYDFVAPEDRERYREFNEQICQGDRGTLEFDVIGLTGRRRRLESHAVPLHRPDGTTVHLALTRDITEQVERERELERALDLLEKTEQIADVGGWEINTETRDVYWTGHIFELLDFQDIDEEPPLDAALEMYHEEDRQTVEEAIDDALAVGESFDIEARIQTADNAIRWLRLKGVPEIDEGDVVSLRGAAQDITERKKREQRLQALIDRLEESNDRLEQFAHAASHDLQEPLRMVSSYLQLIEQRYSDALDEDGQEFLEFAVDGADRMREMIEGLLVYSRVETEGEPLEPTGLETVVSDVLSDLQFQIDESNATISVEEMPRVSGDASQLRQLFQNLLENAITYNGDDPPQIHVTADREDSMWRISVSDEGIGIEPDTQDSIFDMFQRLHAADEYDGAGIGLALCDRIVTRHGGDIWVDSEPGDGTTFSFTLPAVQPTET